MFKLFFIIIFINYSVKVYSQSTESPYSFTLKNAATTSAGVYNNDVLVRTLWTLVNYEAGTYPIYWDGKDDNGNTIPPGNYVVKILSNNLQFNWLGGIGNTSANFSGTFVHHAYSVPISVCVAGNKVYYATGYSEVSPSIFSFLNSAPQIKVDVVPYGTTTKYTSHLCTDGVRLYMSGHDPYSTNTPSYVSAINVIDNSKVAFPSGTNYAQNTGGGYAESAIAYLSTKNAFITGLAVQKSGNYLFLTRSSLNLLYVVNKTTGAIIQTITSLPAPKELCTDITGNLWVSYDTNIIEKFNVNIDGTLTSTGIKIKDRTTPGPMTIVTDGSKITIADYSDSRLYLYNNLTGKYTSSFGAGDYSSTSVVKNDRFAFAGYDAALSYALDGSFWITDGINSRMQHFDSNYNFIENVQFQPPAYSVNVDNGNPQNVFGNYLEYSVNYTKAISGNSGWKFTNNWGGQISKNYNSFEGFKSVHTFNSGGISHKFAFLRRNDFRQGFELVELQSDGAIRFTGIIKDCFIIDETGALIVGPGNPNPGENVVPLYKYTFTGMFDSLNNPIWSSTAQILADISGFANKTDKQLLQGISGSSRNFITADNKIIVYQPGVWVNGDPNQGYVSCDHLGALPKGGNSFLWQTGKNTSPNYNGPFPDPSYFDIGNTVNNYAGSNISIQGNIIVAGYHGEFWKQGQTNKYNIYYSDGLSLGQFGTTTYDTYGEAPAGLAGNALTPQLIKTSNNRLILWHGDESRSGKIQAWELLGENTINEQSIKIVYPDSALNIPIAAGINLMAGLTSGTILQNGKFGWNKSSNELKTDKEKFSTYIGNNSYSNSPDLNINYSMSDANSIVSVTRTLENTDAINSWSLSGKLSWDNNMPNDTFMFDGTHNCNGSYIEILDDKDKIITRFYTTYTISGGYKRQIIGNDKTLINDTEANVMLIQNNFQPFSINASDKNITISYAGYSQTTSNLIDQTANISKPATLRFYFYQNYNGTQSNNKSMDLQGLKFVKKINQNITFNKIASKYYGNIPFSINAISTSNLPISYTIVSGPAKVLGNIVTVTGAGTIVIQATQPGNDTYDAAPPVIQSFTVYPIRVDL